MEKDNRIQVTTQIVNELQTEWMIYFNGILEASPSCTIQSAFQIFFSSSTTTTTKSSFPFARFIYSITVKRK